LLHVSRCKYRMQKIARNSPSGHHRTTLSGCIFATKACCMDSRKKLLNSKFQRVLRLGFVTAPTSRNGSQPNFARCLAIRLLDWYTTYTLLGALVPSRNSARCKIDFTSKSCVLLCWHCYCTALEQWASAKLRRSAEGATYIRHGGHHIRHQPTF